MGQPRGANNRSKIRKRKSKGFHCGRCGGHVFDAEYSGKPVRGSVWCSRCKSTDIRSACGLEATPTELQTLFDRDFASSLGNIPRMTAPSVGTGDMREPISRPNLGQAEADALEWRWVDAKAKCPVCTRNALNWYGEGGAALKGEWNCTECGYHSVVDMYRDPHHDDHADGY